MSAPAALAGWHAYMASRDLLALSDLLDPDAVFSSPVVHRPQHGRELTLGYLSAAAQVLGNPSFRYVGEWIGETSAVLEFEAEVDGIVINGIDMIGWTPEGRISSFKVMVRPLKAINLLHRKMAEALGLSV